MLNSLSGITRFVLLVLLLTTAEFTFAQDPTHSFSQEFAFTGGLEESLPFWLTAQSFGTLPSRKSSGNLRFNYARTGSLNKQLSYSVGTDFISRASSDPAFYFQQLYGKVQWGPFLLTAGRQEETAGEVHPTLSLGSMVLSNNAAPVTGISISWPNFVTIPGTGTFLAIRGSFKHGWIDGNRITTNPWLHAKTMYLRLGKESWRIKAWAGVLHFNMWGGTHRNEAIGPLPSSFNDFLRVVFVRGASQNTVVEGEITNVLGNSVGAYDFGLWYTFDNYVLKLYRQFFLDDTVSMRFRSPLDGMWGLSYSNKKMPAPVEELLWEHVNTKQQGSKSFEIQGTDNYYNHVLYSTGWAHRGRVLGNPLILTRPDQVGIYNNILIAHHFGVSGSFTPFLRYKLLFTYSKNYGAHSIYRTEGFGFTTEDARFEEALTQFAAGMDLRFQLPTNPNFSIHSRLAFDWGELLPDNNFGITLGVARIVR